MEAEKKAPPLQASKQPKTKTAKKHQGWFQVLLWLSLSVLVFGCRAGTLEIPDMGQVDGGNSNDRADDPPADDPPADDPPADDPPADDPPVDDPPADDPPADDPPADDPQDPVDCSGIAANPNYEMCESSSDHCAGVFENGAGCAAYCAAAGLVCNARYGGEPGCQFEAHNPLDCAENNGHQSDWCVCGHGQGDPDPDPDPDPACAPDPGNPPTLHEQNYNQASFAPRSSWVLQCRDYAYTALYAEHEDCDNQYGSGSGRGKATFSFQLPRGYYEVYVEGRHTTNRNPAGAKVLVNSGGQSHVAYLNQRDDRDYVMDLHGRYCLEGSVTVVMDSSVSGASDSVRRVRLVPAP